MKVDRYTILHRKDESGVIVESGVFGPDDEVPDGFEVAEFEPVKTEIRESSVEESKLTPWESPVSLGWTGEPQPDDSLDEVNEGTPVQTRAQMGEELTGAEQEALDQVEGDDEEGDDPPPRGGAGSGVGEWSSYAQSKGVAVPEGATRDEIIAALDAADVRTT